MGDIRVYLRLRCPGCQYLYRYIGKELFVEKCSICGHLGPIDHFVEEVYESERSCLRAGG